MQYAIVRIYFELNLCEQDFECTNPDLNRRFNKLL